MIKKYLLIYLVVIIIAISFFEYSVERTLNDGCDFPVYYHAGQGELLWGPKSYWVYNDKIALIFRPLGGMSYEKAFGIMYAANIISLFWLWFLMRNLRRKYPVVGWTSTIILGLLFSIIVRLGNIDGVLALACTTALGSFLAGCVKPYLFGFFILHAAIYCYRKSSNVFRAPKGDIYNCSNNYIDEQIYSEKIQQ